MKNNKSLKERILLLDRRIQNVNILDNTDGIYRVEIKYTKTWIIGKSGVSLQSKVIEGDEEKVFGDVKDLFL